MYVLASYFYCCMSYLIVLNYSYYLCLCFFLAAFLLSLLIYAAFGHLG